MSRTHPRVRGGYVARYAKTVKELEAVVRAEIVERVIEKVAEAARTGEVGDGKIFVYNVEEAVRIRTGERGPETVQHAERAMWGH